MSDGRGPARILRGLSDVLDQIEALIGDAMASERAGFARALGRLRGERGRIADASLRSASASALGERVAASVAKRAARVAGRLGIAYPEDLPVSERRKEIAAAIREHQVVVVAGETGSGKTTQLPKVCLDAALGLGRGIDGLIGHTQPRRIAARSLAQRIGEELGDPKAAAFKVRFTDTTSPRAYVKVMTDGILLAETQGDPELRAYDTVILDEAHERSLNIDFLIGYLKRLLPRRPELKLVITSATIDTERFAAHFDGAPVIEVTGRTYPVEVVYAPPRAVDAQGNEAEASLEDDVARHVVDALGGLPRDAEDVLVFLPTEREILETAKKLRDGSFPAWNVVPLYGRLPASEQAKVFKLTPGTRRVVLATNVAETSLTVPGVRYVVDAGLARVSRYAARAKVQRLPIEKVSRASADQRAGRCGRVGPGVCVRLYSEADYEGRDAYTLPEIQRSNLAGVILRMAALRLGDPLGFPFLDPPRPAAVRDGLATLHELNAVKRDGRLTAVGQKLARLPVDPRIGRMLFAADAEGCLAEVLVIASALEAQDPRVRPAEKAKLADAKHAAFRDGRSDFLDYLKLWDWYHERKAQLTRRKLDRACGEHYLAALRMREWVDLHRQLRDLVKQAGLRVAGRKPGEVRESQVDAVHRALLTGLLSNVAKKAEKGHEYEAAGGNRPMLWPGSCLFEGKPRWVVSAEQVETSRLFLRTSAPIRAEWIEPLAGHVLKRTHAEPRWVRERGRVMCLETVRLYGLAVVERRPVPFDKVEPAKARELFIHHALVEGDSELGGPWRAHNDALVRDAATLQAKLRRGDVLADEAARFGFYDARLPGDVVGSVTFEQWRERAERGDARVLFMRESDAFAAAVDAETRAAYPDVLAVGGESLGIEYVDSPGDARDGATVTVPIALLNQVDARALSGAVPGWAAARLEAVIRALPKSARKAVGPAPVAAARAAAALRESSSSDPAEAVARALSAASSVPVDARDVDLDAAPAHLRVNVRVVDEGGRVLGESRDLASLRRGLRDRLSGALVEIESDEWNRDGLTDWDFGALPGVVEVAHGGRTVRAHPALVDEGDAVALRLREDAARAAAEHRFGVRRLLYGQLRKEVDWHLGVADGFEAAAVRFATLKQAGSFKEEAGLLVVDRGAALSGRVVRDRAAFDAALEDGWNAIGATTREVVARLAATLDLRQRAELALDGLRGEATAHAASDVRYQLARLFEPGFLSAVPFEWLAQYPRYLQAVLRRLEKLRGGAARDVELARRVVPRLRGFVEAERRHAQEHVSDPALVQYRWLLEEYRVLLWAQDLGTAVPVSDKKLDTAWARVRQ